MGTSFVEYKGFGFWTRDAFLESWLTTLLDELKTVPKLEPWQESLARHWRDQSAIDAGCMSIGLDDFITNDARKAAVLSLARNALARTDPIAHRTAAFDNVRTTQPKSPYVDELRWLLSPEGDDPGE